MSVEVVELSGHIIDSLILAKVLDVIVAAGAEYRLVDVEIGRSATDVSRARIEVSADDPVQLDAILVELQAHGANRVHDRDAVLEPAEQEGVFPAGFYSTTNLPTSARVDGRWIAVENPEMDCAIAIGPDERVRTIPMHRVRAGDRIVTGTHGVHVEAQSRPRDTAAFEFMTSEASSEKPKGLLVAEVADRLRHAKDHGAKVLAVCGPTVIHTGAGPAIARLVRAGWIDVLFAGNGFAAHDLESNVLHTSLGVPMGGETPAEGAHANHLRVINEIRRHGSVRAAVDAGYVDSGVMFECVRAGVPWVLGGSVRDDGPLPDVMTNVVEAADAMRALLDGVGVALMLASTLHTITTGNLLPAWVETFCVDINHAVVTKLTDRGSRQALGIVTDVGLFVGELATLLCPA